MIKQNKANIKLTREKNSIRQIAVMTIIILLLQFVLPTLTIINEDFFNASVIASTTEEYNISTAQELWDFAAEVNGGNTFNGITVNITADIDLGCDENNQWVPIGDYSSDSTNSFEGIFDGQSHSISGIYIDTDKKYQGLFGKNAGTIKKLTINEGEVTSSGSCTGVVVGYNTGYIIEVINEVDITGGDNLGGICGRNYGKIDSCKNNANITGLDTVNGKQLGGISGFNGGSIINSNNTGTIDGNESSGNTSGVGGISGYNEGIVKESINNGYLNNETNAGGIVGYNYHSIINCKNVGNIEGISCLGGIVGQNDYRTNRDGYAIISNCSNSGNITSTLTDGGTSYVGGIVGSSGSATKYGRVVIIESYNTGTIEGSVYIGGICGFQGDGNGGDTSYIKKCWNSGTINSKVYGTESKATNYSDAGGIVGYNNCGYVDECYNTGNVVGIGYIGGIGGFNSAIITNSYNSGNISGSIDLENSSEYQLSKKSLSDAGGIVGYNYDIIENCYNAGKIIADDASSLVTKNTGSIKNCYTVGEIQGTSSSIIGTNSGTVDNCYYLDTTYESNGNENTNMIGYSSSYMKSEKFVELLNNGEKNFCIDTKNINNGYPVLNGRDTISITFNDKILYNKILDILLAKLDNYNDNTKTINLTQDEIETITILDLSNKKIDETEKIEDITGLEYFTNLTELDLGFNNISDISKIANLTDLKVLNLEANNITSMDDIKGLNKLKELRLSYNEISVVPELSCLELTYLDLSANKLTDIREISKLTQLEKLYLENYTYSGVETNRYNEINDISVLENLSSITDVSVTGQKLTMTGEAGSEVSLPNIFIQSQDAKSIGYTEDELILNNCTLNNDGTKVTLSTDSSLDATVKISGRILSNSTLTVNIGETEKTIVGIKVTTVPTKTEYIQNYEELDLTGGILTVTYYDGSVDTVSLTNEKVKVTGFDNTKIGTNTLTVEYEENKVTFDVEIISKEVTGIKVTANPTKIIYIQNYETLDLTSGILTVTYNDGSTDTISLTNEKVKVTGFNNTIVGTNTLTVEYEGKTTTFDIEIISKQITEIQVTAKPIKTIYIQNYEKLDLTGGILTITYNDGSISTVSLTNEKVEVTGFDNTSIGTKTLTVEYEENNTTFDIKVISANKNETGNEKDTDETLAKGVLPKTGSKNIIFIVIILILILAFIFNKKYKNYKDI